MKVAHPPDTAIPPDLSRVQYRVLLSLTIAVAAALRFYALGVRGLWIDEAYSWAITQLPRAEFIRGLTTRALDMALYYTLLRWWSVLGDSEFVLRSFSAVCSVLTVPVVAEVGRRLYSRRAGILTAVLFALHVFSLHYAQEARSYSLVVLLAALGWLQLIRIIRKPGTANWLLFALISTLEFYSHFLSILIIAAQILTLLWVAPLRTHWRMTLRGIGILAIGILPALAYVLHHTADNSWIPPLHWGAIREFLDLVTGQVGSRIYLAFVAALFCWMIVIFLSTWKRQGLGLNTWAISVPVVGFLFPVVALLLISLRQPLFVSRYLLATVVPLIWGIALLCVRVRRLASLVTTALAIIALAYPIPAYYRNFTLAPVRFQDIRGAASYIQSHQQPGDAILIWEPLLRPGLEYYRHPDRRFPEPLFPSGPHLRPEDIGALPDPGTLQPSLQNYPRVWLATLATDTTGHPGWSKFLESSANEQRRLLSEFRSTGIVVREYGPAHD